LQTTKLTNILLANAGHEGGLAHADSAFWEIAEEHGSAHSIEPHHQVGHSLSILRCGVVSPDLGYTSCLELALNGKLDIETRENLSKSHAASKVYIVSVSFFAQGADAGNL
jgi:hypothetical protein